MKQDHSSNDHHPYRGHQQQPQQQRRVLWPMKFLLALTASAVT